MTTRTKHIVMSRVRTIALLRPFVSTSALCVLLGIVSVYAVSREVWVEMVLRNMPSPADVSGFVHFFTYAFLHTGLLVQVFSVVLFVTAVLFLREAGKVLFSFVPLRA